MGQDGSRELELGIYLPLGELGSGKIVSYEEKPD